MNQRIQALKHQASVWCDENIPEQFSEETNGYGRAWEEKFAELIVLECMNVVSKKCASPTAYYALRDHFGVES